MDDSCTRWPDLPPELWMVICKCLETYIDVLRCRGVCRSWRDALPPINAISHLLPLQVPSPPKKMIEDTVLLRRMIYRISPLHHHHQTPAKGWFAMVQTAKKGKLRFIHTLYQYYSYYCCKAVVKKVNLLDFRIQEVAKSYSLTNTNGARDSEISKVVMFPDSPYIDAKNYTVLAMYRNGKLGFAKIGDRKWSMIEEHDFDHGDVIACRGQFYAVNRSGMVFSIDPSTMKLMQISSPLLCGSGIRKHLVECGSEIYVVDKFCCNYSSDSDSDWYDWDDSIDDCKVYKVDLDAEFLKEVKNLGNEAFVLGGDVNFSVSETDFEGIRKNCIYYHQNKLDGDPGHSVYEFDLEKRILKSKYYEQIFPPPRMLMNQMKLDRILKSQSDNDRLFTFPDDYDENDPHRLVFFVPY